jgi:hypothetical protein
MQQAQTHSNGTVEAFTAADTSKSLTDLVMQLLDKWNQIQYYHQLLDFECSETPDTMLLLTNCYKTLSEPHREELELTLKALHKLIKANKGI